MAKKNHEEKLMEELKGTEAPTKHNITIELYDEQGNLIPVEFDDVAGHNVGQNWVAIMLKDGITHVYNAKNVYSFTHYPA